MGTREQVGQMIKTMRLSRNMTQKDLARALGQSESSIAMYERGKREPDFETLETLADIFNVPMSAFLPADDRQQEYVQPASDGVRLLIKGLNKLTPEQLEQATNVMKAMFAQYADYFEGNERDDS